MRLTRTELAVDVVRKSGKDRQQKQSESGEHQEREDRGNEIHIVYTEEVVEEDRSNQQ